MESYPQVSTIDDVVNALKRMASIREQDIVEIGEVLRLRGFESGLSHKTAQKSAAYSVGENDLYVDGVGGAGGITLTLHASPGDGWRHEIWKNDAGVGAVTINGNGKNINGSGTLALAAQYDWAVLVYMGAAGEWRARTG